MRLPSVDIAAIINPMVDPTQSDTTERVAAVLAFMEECSVADGFAASEDCERGKEWVLRTLQAALRFHSGSLANRMSDADSTG